MTTPALFSSTTDAHPLLHIVAFGGGVESAAYLTETLTNPEKHTVDPANLVVLHAVVGSEYDDTIRDCQNHIFPLLRDHGIRLVQLSRRGPRQHHGIKILYDTTTPRIMHRKGPWTLAQHNEMNGISPQLSDRRCSLNFKGFVLDKFILTEFPGRNYTHTICYNRDLCCGFVICPVSTLFGGSSRRQSSMRRLRRG
ncbi:hypothetical protein [Amycolatopsis minnesotensis]|uniref:Uncharacterized protein n=1 Tax=Amycolatopsis minnesotensis TaxID=337894 RepID=A0ABN2QQK2_9PSEU